MPTVEGNFSRDLSAFQEFLDGQPNVFDNPAEKDR
jgi:hypothetical protein